MLPCPVPSSLPCLCAPACWSSPPLAAFLSCLLLCSLPPLLVSSSCPSSSVCVCISFTLMPDRQGALVLFSPLEAHCKQWTAKTMDSIFNTWKAYSSFGTVHNCISFITNLQPSAVITLNKSAHAQLTHNLYTCHPQQLLPINTPPYSQPPIHNTLTSTTKHRVGNGHVNPNLPHTVCRMRHDP